MKLMKKLLGKITLLKICLVIALLLHLVGLNYIAEVYMLKIVQEDQSLNLELTAVTFIDNIPLSSQLLAEEKSIPEAAIRETRVTVDDDVNKHSKNKKITAQKISNINTKQKTNDNVKERKTSKRTLNKEVNQKVKKSEIINEEEKKVTEVANKKEDDLLKSEEIKKDILPEEKKEVDTDIESLKRPVLSKEKAISEAVFEETKIPISDEADKDLITFEEIRRDILPAIKAAKVSKNMKTVEGLALTEEKSLSKTTVKDTKLSISDESDKNNSEMVEGNEIPERVDFSSLKTGEGLISPKLQKYQIPNYPEELQKRGIEGRVILKILIDTGGKIIKIEVFESAGYSQFDKAAKEAIEEWEFNPGQRDGKYIESLILVPIRFKLN